MRRPSAQGSDAAILFDKMETMIELLKVMVGMPPTQMLMAQYPGLQELHASGGTVAGQGRRLNKALELMVAASLPSAPENVQTITVGTTEILLASNESAPLMRVDVTNLNVAQPLIVSKRGVVISAGGLILARQSRPYILPQGSSLFGVVALGTIIVTVGYGYDIQARISALLDADRV